LGSLAVDVVAAVSSQSDSTANAIYVAFIIAAMYARSYRMIPQKASESSHGFAIQFNRNCVSRHGFSPLSPLSKVDVPRFSYR
jgi:hypothetical protein